MGLERFNVEHGVLARRQAPGDDVTTLDCEEVRVTICLAYDGSVTISWYPVIEVLTRRRSMVRQRAPRQRVRGPRGLLSVPFVPSCERTGREHVTALMGCCPLTPEFSRHGGSAASVVRLGPQRYPIGPEGAVPAKMGPCLASFNRLPASFLRPSLLTAWWDHRRQCSPLSSKRRLVETR